MSAERRGKRGRGNEVGWGWEGDTSGGDTRLRKGKHRPRRFLVHKNTQKSRATVGT
jgi:hypothetical protein